MFLSKVSHCHLEKIQEYLSYPSKYKSQIHTLKVPLWLSYLYLPLCPHSNIFASTMNLHCIMSQFANLSPC